MNALGMIEVQSIPLGVNAGDAMLKAATVQLVTAQPVCAGKYIVIVTGEVSAVSESVAAGKAEAGQRLIDSMVISHVHEQVPRRHQRLQRDRRGRCHRRYGGLQPLRSRCRSRCSREGG